MGVLLHLLLAVAGWVSGLRDVRILLQSWGSAVLSAETPDLAWGSLGLQGSQDHVALNLSDTQMPLGAENGEGAWYERDKRGV